MNRLMSWAVASVFVFSSVALAGDEGYQRPVDDLAQLVDAPLTPIASLSPDSETLLLMDRPSLDSIATISEPELRLAGIRINPRNQGPSRDRTYIDLRLVDVASGEVRPVSGLPDSPRIRNARWSPDSKHIAFTIDDASAVTLWVVDIVSSRARRVTDRAIVDVLSGAPIEWFSDTGLILARVAAADRGEEPKKSEVPSGPVIQENEGKVAPARTYQDLLRSRDDEELFDYHASSVVALISLDGEVRALTDPGVIVAVEGAPDGEHILVETLHRPYSYLVPYYRFPRRIEVIDSDGELVKEIVDLPLQEEIPLGFGSVATGIRSISWRSDVPATLYWVEAQDGGNAREEAAIRDQLFLLEAPFDDEPVAGPRIPLRYGGVTWGDRDQAYISEWWWPTRKSRTYEFDPSEPGRPARVIFDYSFEDRYADPGSMVKRVNDHGHEVVDLARDGDFWLIGMGASDEGDRPFLRRYDRRTGETTELFRSRAPHYERPIDFLDSRRRTILTRRESVDDPPNYYARNLRRGTLRPLTGFEHPYPDLKGIQKEFITYEREDGVKMSAMLYLPPGYDPDRDGPLPGFVWAYPNEFKDADAAGQVQDSPYRFKFVSAWGPIPWVIRGYAVFDDASMPVIGEGDEEPNDTFREQLVMNARAVVAEGVRRGVLDPDRVGVGGHSYGAFMTANLLAHSDVFAAGIARSGAYNRSLTPFGFQAEERTFWEAPEVYFTMSPFMNADEIDEPLLMIHGEADNNSGTYPMQSERLYNALKGLGATTRLVMFPHESHGYRAYESMMHMLWEQDRWLEKHVKNRETSEEND